MEILPPKYQKYRMFPQLQQNDENEQMQKAIDVKLQREKDNCR